MVQQPQLGFKFMYTEILCRWCLATIPKLEQMQLYRHADPRLSPIVTLTPNLNLTLTLWLLRTFLWTMFLTTFGVDSSNHFPFQAHTGTDRQRHRDKVLDTTECPTHVTALKQHCVICWFCVCAIECASGVNGIIEGVFFWENVKCWNVRVNLCLMCR